MTTIPPRTLQRRHFAFMRALLQGLDERDSWNRYLRREGETADLRAIRHTTAWIRDAFAAAAHREAKPGTARLVRLDPERLRPSRPLPTLEAFALEQGLEDFSEAEQAEAYAQTYPEAGRGDAPGRAKPSHRARVIARQLEALRWLEDHSAPDPREQDPVGAWLNPAVAARLVAAGMPTLRALVDRIHEEGARWWRTVPGVGAGKGARVVAWLRTQEGQPRLSLPAHAMAAPALHPLDRTELWASDPTAPVPLEKLQVPHGLDGREGVYRAPQAHCLLAAQNDPEAINAWLHSKSSGSGAARLNATQRAYRREAERLLLWSVLERGRAVSSLTLEDANAYVAFLAAPPPAWCGPRYEKRASGRWRPLEGPLSVAGRRQAVTVLRCFYGFLVAHRYAIGNPFAAHAALTPPVRPPALGTNRTLSTVQWQQLDGLLDQRVGSEAQRRTARSLRWLYATGLRLSELAEACCGDLTPSDSASGDGQRKRTWELVVAGNGERRRWVPVPADLVAELQNEVVRHGGDPDFWTGPHAALPLLARFTGKKATAAWSASAMAKAIQSMLRACAQQSAVGRAELPLKASAHWLRHSHACHALQGTSNRRPQTLLAVRNNLGHASVATTASYLRA